MYLSALPFAPEESHVARKFRSRFHDVFEVTQGKPSQWPMAVLTAEHHKASVFHMDFSPDKSMFSSTSLGAAYICDSMTGHCISGPFEIFGMSEARFSPTGKHILFKYWSYAVVWDIERCEEQFRIEGSDFAFIHHDGRIASVVWFDEGGNSDDSEDKGATRILVRFWDASNGALIPNRLLEVNDAGVARFSPDGHFLAIGKKSENVIEMWNLEDRKVSRQFTYPHGNLSFLRFSPTSDTLVVGSVNNPCQVYLWRLDTQEMVSFSHDLYHAPHIIHSLLTNYLFIQQLDTVEIWDISATGSKMIWEMKLASNSGISSICPSCDGHRFLVGYGDGSVRMWNLDLENLAINQADTMDTRNDTDEPRVITVSPSGKMVVTRSQQSSNIEFLDTITREVVARTDIEYKWDMEIAFSPDEDQVAFLSESLITIRNMMHPKNRVSFDPWPGKSAWTKKVAFQTCNDLVICAISHDYSALLQVWHRQDPADFECSYSLDITNLCDVVMAPNGLTIAISDSIYSSATCFSWNHDIARFDPVYFDDQVHIPSYPSPALSPDGELFVCWSDYDPCVRVWDTRTGQLVSKFPTLEVYRIALSPALINHSLGKNSLGKRLIALEFKHRNAIGLFDAYTGHLHAQILSQKKAYMKFIRDGTALAYYSSDFGLRIWDIKDLTMEHWRSTRGYELISQDMMDGWVMGQDNELLFWVPVEHRRHLCAPPFRVVIEGSRISTILDYSNSRFGTKWTEYINKGWSRELERKEKELGNLFE